MKTIKNNKKQYEYLVVEIITFKNDFVTTSGEDSEDGDTLFKFDW